MTHEDLVSRGWTETHITGLYVWPGTLWNYSTHDTWVRLDDAAVCVISDVHEMKAFLYGVKLK